MTRKRYIKQLMALGIQRNQANTMATLCRVAGKSYETDLRRRRPWMQLARAARQVSATILNASKYFNDLAAAAAKALGGLVVHHAQPITPDNLEGGNMYIVTQQEHERLHGYSAKVSFADEIETAGGGQA